MILKFLSNIAFVLLLFTVIDKLYSSILSITVTSYIVDLFNDISSVNLGYLFIYLVLMLISYSFIGAISVFIYSFLRSKPSILNVLIIFLFSNTICLFKDILLGANHISHNSYFIYIGVISILIERTIGFFLGGYIILRLI